MLNYSEFQPYSSSKSYFKFRKLVPSQGSNFYSCADTNRCFHVSIFTNSHHFSILHCLFLKGYFGNIRGFFKRKNVYYCFSQVSGFTTLAGHIENINGQKDLIDEVFCLQLVESVLDMAKDFKEANFNIKIINPHHIIVSQIRKDSWKFTLAYPMSYNIFQGLNTNIIAQEIQFCAPQILCKDVGDNEYNLHRKYFPKAVLYSLGLVLLFCFGYRIKGQERRRANLKQFNIFLKAIRKQIKVLQQGKFISKLIKILMEDNDYVRDSLETFQIKLHSAHLQSLRKFRYLPAIQQQKQIYAPTIYSENSQQLQKTGLNRTIQIQGSSLSVLKTNKRSEDSQERIDLSIDQGLPIFKTFKKSPQSFTMPQIIKEEQQQRARQDIKMQITSPIQIQLDWDDSDDEKDKKSLKKSERQMKNIPIVNYIDQKLKIPQKDIAIFVLEAQKEDTKISSKRKQDNKRLTNIIEKSSKSNNAEDYDIRQINEVEAESKDQLHTSGVFKIQPDKVIDKYHIMVEQQPQIIKYSEGDYKIGISPRLSKKRISRDSGDLQDMTLLQEETIQEKDIQQPESRIDSNYFEMKEQFSQRSEAIFITLLIGFLIYKVVDFVIK